MNASTPTSQSGQIAWLIQQIRRLRVPPKIYRYTRVGVISAVSGADPLHNDTGIVLAIKAVRVSLGAAPSSQPVIVDVTTGGTSIFTGSLPQVEVGTTIGDPVVPDVAKWARGDALYVNVTQGDTDATDLRVTIAVA